MNSLFEWCIGRFDGPSAKSVAEHAAAGLGYHVLKTEGRGMNYVVVAAFKRPINNPRPHHLELAPDNLIKKLELKDQARLGIKPS